MEQQILDGVTMLLLQAVIGFGTVIVLIVGLILSKIWREIGRLRDVRHADREILTEIRGTQTMMRMDLDDHKRRTQIQIDNILKRE